MQAVEREAAILHEQNGVAILIELIMDTLTERRKQVVDLRARDQDGDEDDFDDFGELAKDWASGHMDTEHKMVASSIISLLNLSVDARTVQQVYSVLRVLQAVSG